VRGPLPVRHEFVELIPRELELGVLYVSLRYRTATHLCPSGCNQEVMTPLGRDDWTLSFDGTVSLYPSVGSWGLPCRSHYWIKRDEIVWARTWSSAEIADLRRRERIALGYGAQPSPTEGWTRRLWRRLTAVASRLPLSSTLAGWFARLRRGA
jgi:hypothetical protein